MSLDDECPTQYFGADAVTFVGPHGKPIRVSQEQYYRLTESGALTDEQMLNAVIDGRSLQDLLDEANGVSVISLDDMNKGVDPAYGDLFHRQGCSVQRNDRCICAYLAQWDATGYLAPTFRKDQQ